MRRFWKKQPPEPDEATVADMLDEQAALERISSIKQDIQLIGSRPIKFDQTNTEWIEHQAALYGVDFNEFVTTLLDAVRCKDIVRHCMADHRGLPEATKETTPRKALSS
jgi:hypothetical protein